jgi:hypothetical protein
MLARAMAMSRQEITDERRRGRVAGIAAIASAVLLSAATVWSGVINSDRPSKGEARQLRFFDDHAGELIAITALRAVAFLLVILAIVHLHRALVARTETSSTALLVGVFGAVALAIGGLAQSIALASEASDFSARGFTSARAADQAAEDVASEPFPLVSGIVAFAGTLGLAFWFVIGSLSAMRAGLLTRFIGVLGIIVGPAFVFGFGLPVMFFWLLAIGVLFLGRWPRGLPPAWDAGEPVPWTPLSAPAEAPAEPEAIGGSRNGDVDPVGPGVKKPDAPGGNPDEPVEQRQKRKRRR